MVGSRLGSLLTLVAGLSCAAYGDMITTVDFPAAVSTSVYGINNLGQIVGSYFDGSQYHAFLNSGGVFSTVTDPGLIASPYAYYAAGINDSGAITLNSEGTSGLFNAAVDNSGSFSSIHYPGSSFTGAGGINKSGEIVGFFSDTSNEFAQAFSYIGGAFTVLDDPGATQTLASGVDSAGDIVGYDTDSSGYHGFLDVGGTFTSIEYPGAENKTDATGINDSGEIVGYYQISAIDHGFIDVGGVYTTFDIPGAEQTVIEGVNNEGALVGYYYDSAGKLHGFVDTPTLATPEPSGFILSITVFAAMAAALPWRRRFARGTALPPVA